MTDINFCPFCDAAAHKINMINDTALFCRECNRFFKLDQLDLKCVKCTSTDIVDSDFPSPDGNMIFQCKKCKQMFDVKKLLERNGLN